MAWDDDENEETTSPAVTAFMGDEEGGAPENVPGPVDGTPQQVAVSNPETDSTNHEDYVTQPDTSWSPNPGPYQMDDQPGDTAQATSQGPPEASAKWESVPDGKSHMGPQTTEDQMYDQIQPPAAVQMAPYIQSQAPGQLAQAKAAFNPAAYKPSVGRRILAGVAGFAGGMGSRNAAEGLRVGQEITGAPLRRAQAIEAQKESGIQAQADADAAQNRTIQQNNQTAEQQGRLNEQDFRNRSLAQQNNARATDFAAQAQARRSAPIAFTPADPTDPYKGGTRTQADGQTVKVAAPTDADIAAWAKTPSGQSATRARMMQDANDQADQIFGKGKGGIARQQYIGNLTGGHLTEAALMAGAGGGNSGGGGSSAPQTGGVSAGNLAPLIAKNMQDKNTFASQWTRNDNGTYSDTAGHTIDGPTFNAKIEQFRTNLNANPAMRKAGIWVDATGVTRGPGEPQTAKVSSGATLKAGDPVSYNGKTGVVIDINPQTGKPVVRWN